MVYKDRTPRKNDWFSFLLIASVVLLLDSVVIGHYFGFVRLPGEMSELDVAKNGAVVYINSFREDVAEEEAVNVLRVRNAISRYESEIMKSRSREEVGFQLSSMMAELSEMMDEERLNFANRRVLELLGEDEHISGNEKANGYILISVIGGYVQITDTSNLVKKDTREAIRADLAIANTPQPIAVVVTDGFVELELTNIDTRIETLSHEINTLSSLYKQISEESGFMEVSGEGVIIQAYDAEGGSLWDEIVHDADILDIINCLMDSGAKGVQVGSERIIATSSVRCVGPVVLINQRPVAVNPIKLIAVGDQDAMCESLSLIAEDFARSGKSLEIVREEKVTLEPYRKVEVNW